jgi:signal transduction histidine kinase
LEKAINVRGGIRRKVTLTILIVSSAVLFSGIALTYFMGLNLLSNVLGTQYFQAAQRLGSLAMDSIKGELEDSRVYTKLTLWRDMVKEADLKYKDMGPKDMAAYFESMDKKWVLADKKDPALWGYMNNRVSVAMRDIAATRSGIAEIFITDRYGGLVATSGKTSDFYQADEEWWQKAFNGGKGGTYISDVECDESSNSWCISIALSMFDDKGELIGICKNSLSLNRLLNDIAVFRIDNTGRAFVVDGEGKVLFPRDVKYADKQVFSKDALNKLLSGNKRFMFMHNGMLSDKKLFAAFSSITPPIDRIHGARWTIFVIQEAAEMSVPLERFVTHLGLITICLIALMVPLGLFFGDRLVRPIQKLREATKRFMAGEKKLGLDIRTNDEIEEFADLFSKMLTDIEHKQKELEEFSRGLEDKVSERTRKLTETQEATFNILEDLEESKAQLELTNKELKKLDQLKSDFVSTVSHELRTPLSIIKEGVSLVLDGVSGDVSEKQRKILDISKFNIDRLARIIDSLLDISKIEAGKVELKRSLVSVAEITRQVALSFEIKIKEKGLALKLDVDKSKGKVYADPDRMAQVVTNLIGNALKFTQSGRIEVSCEDKKDMVVCSVKDTGVGISRDDLPKIFNKFQQFGRLAGAGEKGTGLGLSIAKGIMDMHDGSISVESEPQKGACFTFALHRYTEQSLFNEFTDIALKTAAQSKTNASIITISCKMKESPDAAELQAGFDQAVTEMARTIKDTLRRQDDRVVTNGPDMLIMLVNCGKEHCAQVLKRLEQIIDKYLDSKKIKGMVDVRCACATFPEDGKTGLELVNTARSRAAGAHG